MVGSLRQCVIEEIWLPELKGKKSACGPEGKGEEHETAPLKNVCAAFASEPDFRGLLRKIQLSRPLPNLLCELSHTHSIT